MVILDEIAGEHLSLLMTQTINKRLRRAVGSIAALGLARIFDKLLDVLRMLFAGLQPPAAAVAR